MPKFNPGDVFTVIRQYFRISHGCDYLVRDPGWNGMHVIVKYVVTEPCGINSLIHPDNLIHEQGPW